MNDKAIIALFLARNPDAIRETDKLYGRRLLGIAQRILQIPEDAQECVNDTYYKAWETIPPTIPRNLFAYLAKICRHRALGMLDYQNAAKRNAEVVSLKSAETDGYTATITLGITTPEGTVLMDPSIKDYQVSPGNWYNCLTGPVYVGYEGTCAEDGDGQDNTMDYVIKASSIFTDGRKAFTAESAWRIYFEDICGNYWDETALEMVYAPIAEGTWVIDISFAD